MSAQMIVDNALIDGLLEAARTDPRLRRALVLSDGPERPMQVLVNALLPGTRVAPHRFAGRDQVICVLRGEVGLLTWSGIAPTLPPEKRAWEARILSAGEVVRFPAEEGRFHALVVPRWVRGAAILETLPGPHDPASRENLDGFPEESSDSYLPVLREQERVFAAIAGRLSAY